MIKKAIEQGLAAGLDDVVAKQVSRQEKQVKFHRNEISTIKTWDTVRLHLFMAKGKRVFSMGLENPDERDIHQAIEQAKKVMSVIAPKDQYYGIGRPTGQYTNTKKYDPQIADEARLCSLVERAIDEGLCHAEEVAGVAYAGTDAIQIQSSQGAAATDANSWLTLSIRAFASDTASGHAVACGRKATDISPQIGSEAGQHAIAANAPHPVERGTYDIVFAPMAFADLIASVVNFSSAFNIDNGMSPFAGKQGQKVGNEVLTVQDSGVHENGIASRLFDDEGTATKETTIIEHGILRTYLHNTSTAHHHKTVSTGNAGILYPESWNGVVVPGDASLDALIASVSHGLLVTNVWYTRFQNYLTGDFSTIARDGTFAIENGSISHPVEGVRISDNLMNIMQNVTELAAESKQVYWWGVDLPVFTPAALVKNVSVTRSFL
jgi:PmbA protein